jgi:hypothetical protein
MRSMSSPAVTVAVRQRPFDRERIASKCSHGRRRGEITLQRQLGAAELFDRCASSEARECGYGEMSYRSSGYEAATDTVVASRSMVGRVDA